MPDSGAATIGLPCARAEARSAAMNDGQTLVQRESSIRLRSLLVNVLVSLFYVFFLYTSIQYWLRTGSLVGIGLVACNSLVVGCLLTRKNASAVTESIPNWILASLTQVAPLVLRPVGSSVPTLLFVSGIGQVVGVGLMIASLMALNRSIGVFAANRGIKTRGPYAWIRHPLYAGEILFDVSFLLSNWSSWNGALILALILAQVVRSVQEESLLLGDERYVLYRTAVPYRMVPWVF
jgi:protein-S-isoprenylcysteine O-methyltransferase Ste14